MITYVNTVLVSNQNGATLVTSAQMEGVATKADLAALVGKFAVMNCDPAKQDGTPLTDIYTIDATVDTFKIGVVTDKFITKFDKTNNRTVYVPVVKWSNEIKAADIKSLTKLTYQDDTQDIITIDFSTIDANTQSLIAAGNIDIVVRLSWKDLPTRYRQWTDSYDYLTKLGDTPASIAAAFAETINKQSKRARAIATVDGSKLILEAMEYDDDLADNTENPVGKVRFNANVYFMNPQAAGWASSNKYDLGVTISKQAGVTYPASAKLVRFREHESWGYEGILHRCKWYDVTPALVANINNKYGGITLEFENRYHTADDWIKRTKQTVEIYASNNGAAMAPDAIGNGLLAVLTAIIAERQDIVNPVDNSEAYNPANFENA